MDIQEFNYTAHELWAHWKDVPLRWNSVQNDLMDNELDLFRIRTLPEFEQATAKMNEKLKTYWLRRWFIWRHSVCDEFLFSMIPGVTCPKQKRTSLKAAVLCQPVQTNPILLRTSLAQDDNGRRL